ncbi:type I pantothenate kinase [Rarobacter faecitabidus]|uniref:Pantothenate kinase n=1 Tax=Rarobacter faecitabidus TaxID=13243 RepID=A0A542ZXH8_RARFA|nr:type I pantothenate kinase [Rarobacter faecitabidus]TQL65057.1 pantothenate kinase [Rarobacter faecitabidus]
MDDLEGASPYVSFDRESWSRLSESTPLPLNQADVRRLRGLGDPVDLHEVDVVYRPLSRLLSLYAGAAETLHQASSTFLRERWDGTPFVIGIAGSVAVGKSTVSRILREMLARWPETPKVSLVTTDGFLLPNSVLTARGLMDRKGFPESYDRRALIRFLAQVKSGADEVFAPVYSHLTYDIVPDEFIAVRRPDVLIVEGLNVLQPARTTPEHPSSLAVSDFFDFSIYIDADEADIRHWYVERFLSLRQTAFADPASYFHRYASLTDEAATGEALRIWDQINAPNLRENVAPTRSRATLVLRKGASHSVEQIHLRKR